MKLRDILFTIWGGAISSLLFLGYAGSLNEHNSQAAIFCGFSLFAAWLIGIVVTVATE